MSWEGDNNGDSDPLPVDTLVKGLRDVLDDFNGVCSEYRGQEKHCCDSVRSCYNNLSSTLVNVRLQAALRQNIHRACRQLDEHFHVINNCVDNKLRLCNKIDTTRLTNEFQERKGKFKSEFDRHCSDLPPEQTNPPTPTPTTTTTTTEVTTTSTSTTTDVITTTTIPPTTLPYLTSPKELTHTVPVTRKTFNTTTDFSTSFSKTPGHSNNGVTNTSPDSRTSTTTTLISKAIQSSTRVSARPPTRPPTDTTNSISSTGTSTTKAGGNDSLEGGSGIVDHPVSDNTIVIVSAVCSVFIILLVLLVIVAIKLRKKRMMTGLNYCPCRQCVSWKWLQKDNVEPNHTDGEIYDEINEDFMKAVYEFDIKKDPHPNLKNRVQSNAHVNVCYSSGMDNDDIIASMKANAPTLQLSTRNLRQVPRQNEYETSKGLQKQPEKTTKPAFVMSHPTFTDPRGTDVISDEYVQISEKYEEIPSIYDQPNIENRTVHSVKFETERDEYDHIIAKEAELEDDGDEESVYEDYDPSYVNAKVSQNNDHLYENELNEYEITQSRF